MDTPLISMTALEALHMLRIGGSATRADVIAATDDDVVDSLVADELVTVAGPRLRLSARGRQLHEGALARELDDTGCRSLIEDAYQRFLPVNADVLQLCTDWQMRTVDGVPTLNDHRDEAHDASVIARLEAAATEAGELLAAPGERLVRFATYRAELLTAAERVDRGNTDFLTNPRVRCFHTIWFELHEDLLATLGIDRADEHGTVTAASG